MTHDNSAPYGPNIASYAVKITIVGNEEMVINDIGSGIRYDTPLKFALLDYDEQVMVLNNVDQIILTPVNSTISSIGGVNSALTRNGVSTFDNLVAIAKYGAKDIKYQANSKAIDSTKILIALGSLIWDNIVSFNFRNCMPGESIIDNHRCQECSAGSYSLEWNSPE